MAKVNGVGVKKLEAYGDGFLEVIAGAPPPDQHPARRKLAGREAGPLADRLHAAQLQLARGECGTEKYLNCNQATLSHIAERRPATLADLERVPGMGPQKTERFGRTFLELLAEA